ncbi:SRPBCC family protein [Chitinophaga nivalis]|uniref:SRPBCC domain-containing protein n=1 Tax=Chitinophaga nivalis TaxID=2991709 RepID=A0ABT3IPT7_9BACT|nr:SRPBCC domain-containing protein [Chitinophaga nivalis]MCW3464555.1 SRPBCC domain-containing protein [Chitinophaga nivalis]MCW3485754.1 SRPBCC domain-containing protein [Chitinophaga nivalis]
MENIEHINYLKAPIGKVYEVLTTAAGLAAVWTNKLEVEPRVGFVNTFDFNDNYATRMKILELVENKRIWWECIASDPEWVGTQVTFELSEKNGVTTVLLRHLYWRELTTFYRYCNYNWAMFLFSLKSYCEEGQGLPFQERKF